ncbi:PREDICTED: 39S ribosomal protein L52, mitochondrial [Papilio polytes]|uniref:39S ribosomal protein L52, mitochondrial n=1 Tax=Papilio polytes TaxID=76194 RepID=UPI0006762464|nr:PREDICTED: 39S ribosomal protein L52, mitochondrial [Papilio polytes]
MHLTNLITKNLLSVCKQSSRTISCTQISNIKEWRVSRGLPVNKNAEGILTDGPDYTFLDGIPTPLLHKQKLRMLKQRDFASRIVELSSELDFAKTRQQKMLEAKEEERKAILSNRLKPKGKALLNKK